jgi:hypothetical protein
MRVVLIAIYGGGPVWLIDGLPGGMCEIHTAKKKARRGGGPKLSM